MKKTVGDFKKGERVQIKQRPGIRECGPMIGDIGIVDYAGPNTISVLFEDGRYWAFWPCEGSGYHHNSQECFCMFNSVRIWRKL